MEQRVKVELSGIVAGAVLTLALLASGYLLVLPNRLKT